MPRLRLNRTARPFISARSSALISSIAIHNNTPRRRRVAFREQDAKVRVLFLLYERSAPKAGAPHPSNRNASPHERQNRAFVGTPIRRLLGTPTSRQRSAETKDLIFKTVDAT